MDAATFFATVRTTLFGGALSQATVDRINALFAAFAVYGDGDIRKLAYCCATAHRESGAFRYDREIWGPTLQQKKYEPGTDLAKELGNTKAGDGKRFMGRGFVCMITGRKNYADWGERLGLDLVGNPDLAAQVDYAARIGVDGMMLGTFTAKKLADYINATGCDYRNARRVVNGIDHADEIAANAVKYQAALDAAGYAANASSETVAPPSIEERLARLEAAVFAV